MNGHIDAAKTTPGDRATLRNFARTLPGGQLREALLHIADLLDEGESVFVWSIEGEK
ncbi:hypothetical protein [Nocardia flavorosea]|uniref:Uncharacterized protein n=1 Tax=Nocardia flavorosea TaxID=53429 RepID=A0A846YUW3_9NOCA|nr:hypothetical protein [Nocardia flavorosea]NKY60789.1 hypothetical protein [Nocardia flavorosea]